jgi:hypothetical protein
MNASVMGVLIIAEMIGYFSVLSGVTEITQVDLFIRMSWGKTQKGATMKKVAIYAGLFAILISPLAVPTTTAAQSSVNAEANAVSVTGKVSCSRFGTGSITARKGMSIAQTIWYCATFQGGQYTLVSGKQIFRLTGDKNLLAKMSGQTVVVAGHVNQDEPEAASYALMGTLQATTIAPAKN